MIKIGLTGGIGSGKSLIAKLFRMLGIYVYNTDDAAKKMYYTNVDLKQKMINYFGKEIYLSSGKLNKEYLSKQIFCNKTKLELINSWVHPLVKTDFENQIKLNENSPYIVKESAILIESKAYKNMDKIIVVSAPEDLRIERVCKRNNISKKQVMERIKNQLANNQLLKYADFVIENDNNKLLMPQVLNIHKILTNC